MLRLFRRVSREPELLAASLWPLALLTPFIPGLPRPTNGGLGWRQEVFVGLLLCGSLALGLRRLRDRGEAGGRASRAESLLLAALACFVALSAASLVWSANPFGALHHTLTWASYALFFVVMRRAASRPRLLRASVKSFGLVVFVIAASNCVGHWATPDSLIRKVGLGEPVAVAIPFFAALALRLRRGRAALFCGATAAVAWLSMLQIAERAPFIGVCVGLLLLAAASAASARFRPRGAVRVGALAAAFALCAALQFAPSPFEESAHQPVFERLRTASVTETNARARFLFWGAALEMFRSRPLLGVGAGGYDAAFAEGRAEFVARRPDSPLAEVNESFLTVRAHNEYLQILAELGAVGLALFCAFSAALVWLAFGALRRARGPVLPGAAASLAAFAVSSGASSLSFRWTGSGLVFFFAAALVAGFAKASAVKDEGRRGLPFQFTPRLLRAAHAGALAVALLTTALMSAHGANVLLQAAAQATADEARADKLFRAALALNPLDASARMNYGLWLVARKRDREAVEHLRLAVARGFNTSTCYQYLAGAESSAGKLEAAERTMAYAVRVYPRSVFARVRHASALRRLGRTAEAELEMSAALLLDSRSARGWEQLIEHDIEAASVAAQRDPARIKRPGDLWPMDAIFAVLDENERRFPSAAAEGGWRAQIRSFKLR